MLVMNGPREAGLMLELNETYNQEHIQEATLDRELIRSLFAQL